MPRGKDLKVRQRRSDRHQPDDLVKCGSCGRYFERQALSTQGFCGECGMMRLAECCRQLQAKEGFYYERYVAGIERSKINMKGGSHGKEDK